MAIAASVAIVLLVASGCGAAPTERSEPPSSTVAETTPPDTAAPTTTTTAPPSADELEVRALMDRFWPAYQQAILVTAEYTTAVARYDDVWRITVRDASEYLEGVRDCELFT